MSKFSGKCDFCDEIEIFGLEHILNSEVYVGDNKEPLKLTCLADCVPYFPHLVCLSHHDTKKNCGHIWLTEKSWVDIEAERYGEHQIHEYYREELRKELIRAQLPGYSMKER